MGRENLPTPTVIKDNEVLNQARNVRSFAIKAGMNVLEPKEQIK